MTTALATLQHTTELEAVNTIFAGTGIAPIKDLNAPLRSDAEMAIQLLRQTAAAVCNMSWRFNTEFGYQILPTLAITWQPFLVPPTPTGALVYPPPAPDPAVPPIVLNVFLPPADLARFTVSHTWKQVMPEPASVSIAVPKTIDKTLYPFVFYDRVRNRDGWDAATFKFLYIDPVWYRDFEAMPQEARQFIAISTARQFAERVMGSPDAGRVTQADEARAYMLLQRTQGMSDETLNMFNNLESNAFMGNRPGIPQGTIDERTFPRGG